MADPTGTKISILNEDYPNSNPPSDICGSIYDIARAQWGKDWRLPSKDEIEMNCWHSVHGYLLL